MSRIEQKFLSLVKENSLISVGDKILIGLSGGPDSVFLLHLLVKYRKKYQIVLGAAHLNHSIRGISADKDELFCKELCKNLNVQYFSKKLDIISLAALRKISVEETARDERYLFFNAIALENGYNKIATAHNLNDNTETVLLNLIKGTGLKGIAGIPLIRDRIIRPVLNIGKEEILDYLKNKNIPYRIDFTNESDLYERNFIRNNLIPLIRKTLNPSVDKSIYNSSRVFRNELEIVENYIESISADLVEFQNDTLTIKLDNLALYNKAVLGVLLRKVIRKHFDHEIEYNDFVKVKELITKQTGKRIFLSGKLFSYKERGIIFIGRSTDQAEEANQINFKVDESCLFNDTEIRISRRNETESFKNDKFHEIISADDLDESFLVRKWKNGDKFIPLGMKNFKKVSDFLTEQKIESNKKKEQLVLLNKNEIIWLPGFRIDDRVKIRKETKRIYELWMIQKA